MKTKISIIIPCYNAERWISQCINSALNQSYDNCEVIVVDNESTDKSFSIIQSIKENNQGLIVSTAPNLYKHSWTEPVEEALSLSSGEYFTILGADDYIREDYVEKIAEVLEKAGGKIEVFQTPILGVDSDNVIVNGGQVSHSYKNITDFKDKLFRGCPVNTPTVVYKKQLHLDGLLVWDSEKYLGAADYNLYFNLVDNNKFIYPFPEWIGYCYRWHPGHSTWGMHRENIKFDEKIKDYWREKWQK